MTAVPPMTDSLWNRVKKRSPDECWPWTGYRTKLGGRSHGYGRLGGKIASRLIYERAHGPIPAGMFVIHRCDNPSCCNPTHLAVGLPRDNSADMVAKGRSSRGEKRPLARLTDKQAKTIRTDTRSLKAIAADYGISITLVSAIRLGHRWTHI